MPLQVPATVRDALTVTLNLGYQYLWCDVYYIGQADEVHKADQISKMDIIYRGAELTIIAGGPNKHHGLPGVSATRTSSYEEFRLRGRTSVSFCPDPCEEL
jgi:hypothetical protein